MDNKKLVVVSDGANIKAFYTLSPGERVMSFPHGMLINNNIAGIPRYNMSSEQGVTRLIYSVSNAVRLSDMIKRSIPKSTLLAVFDSITDVMLASEEYMLDPEGFVLDVDNVFINNGRIAANIIYLPTNMRSGTTLRTLLKDCISQGIFDLRDDSAYPMVINNYLNTQQVVSPREFKKFLNSMRGGAVSAPVQAPAAQMQPVHTAQAPVQRQAPAAPVQSAPVPTPAPQPAADKSAHKGGLFGRKEKKTAEQPQQSVPAGFGGMAIPGVNPMAAPPAQKAPEKKQTAAKAAPQAAPQKAACAFFTDRQQVRIEIKGNVFWIGRSRQSEIVNNLILSNPGVGKNHAFVEFANGKYYLTDNNSQNGTFVNGQRIQGNVRTELHNGDKVAFWNEEFVFNN